MLNRQKTYTVLLSIVLLSAALVALAQSAQQPPVGVARFSNPPAISRPVGYSHVAEVRGGKVIYVAGQVALDRAGNLVGPGDFGAQAQQAFENVKSALEASGASFKDVVKLNNYLVDISQLAAFREVRDKYVNTSTPPASTTVEVRKLFREDVLIEVEAVAVVP